MLDSSRYSIISGIVDRVLILYCKKCEDVVKRGVGGALLSDLIQVAETHEKETHG